MERLRQRTKLPLAIDESSVSPGDFYEYARRGLVDYFVLKVTRTGGLWPSYVQMCTAAAAGIPTVVSGLTDGLLTKLAACQLAAAFGVFKPIAMNGSQFVDEAALYPRKAEIEAGGVVKLPLGPGIGVRPDEDAVRALLLKL
jgi:muconate cycloisomerase